MMKFLGYILTAVVAPVVGFLVTKHVDPMLGTTLAGGVATAGGLVLHMQDPPGSGAPKQ